MSTTSDTKPDNYQVNAKICRLVEQYPCMYDRSHPYYLKKDVVDKAWIKIAKEMDDSIPSCKERWRNIRTSFARSINVNKIPSSANRTKPYYLHEELQFLARHITPGIPISRRTNYCSASEESEVIEVSVGEESFDGFAAMMQQAEEDSREEDAECQRSSSVDEGNETMQQMEQQQQTQAACNSMPPRAIEEMNAHAVTTAISTITPTTTTTPPALYPFKKRLRTELMEYDVEEKRDVKPLPSELAQESDFDATFLQGLLPEMKAMDFRQKILFKKRIYEVIGEIFESTPHTTNNSNNNTSSCNELSQRASPPMAASSTTYNNSCSSSSATPTIMTMVNAADLAMIRRLNTLLQNPTVASTSSPMTTLHKQATAISSTVRTNNSPPTVHRGALTRASANLLRVATSSTTSSLTAASQQQLQTVKQEIDDD